MAHETWARFDPAELVTVLLPETREALDRLRSVAGPDGPAFFLYVLTHWRGTQSLDGWGASAESMERFVSAKALSPDALARRRREFLHLSGEWSGVDDRTGRFEESSKLVSRWEETSYDEEDPPGAMVDQIEEYSEMDLAVVEACRRVLRTLDAEGRLRTKSGFAGSSRLLVGVMAMDDDESRTEQLLRELNPPELIAWWPK